MPKGSPVMPKLLFPHCLVNVPEAWSMKIQKKKEKIMRNVVKLYATYTYKSLLENMRKNIMKNSPYAPISRK
jgi:hypothetical protein